MRVSELAGRVGTTAKTIRFYEAEGVLPAPPRRENGYRDYDEADVCRTRLVIALRALGLELSEAGRLAELCVTGRCDTMLDDLGTRVAERRRAVAAARAELAHVDAELASVERMLATGQPHPTLCLGKEEG
jgi:DNA-binding transcriptional MerR regulator